MSGRSKSGLCFFPDANNDVPGNVNNRHPNIPVQRTFSHESIKAASV